VVRVQELPPRPGRRRAGDGLLPVGQVVSGDMAQVRRGRGEIE
jgi:hypothetical protein